MQFDTYIMKLFIGKRNWIQKQKGILQFGLWLTSAVATQKYNLRTGTLSSVYAISRHARNRWFFGDVKKSDGLRCEPPNFRFPKCCMWCIIISFLLLRFGFNLSFFNVQLLLLLLLFVQSKSLYFFFVPLSRNRRSDKSRFWI